MSQASRLLELLEDGKPHRTDEILKKVYHWEHAGIARIGARIWDLKQKGFPIQGKKDEDKPSLYWYRLIKEGQQNLL